MVSAAGTLFLAPDGRALFVKRSAAGDHANEWCFPGGRLEGNETADEAACREAIEEIGFLPKGERKLHVRQITPSAPQADGTGPADDTPQPNAGPVDFTTFIQKVEDAFVPTLNDEHVGYAWAPPESPPEPLHPGCRVALDRLTMDELGVARAMEAGQLTSPQVYENVHLWLIRITGTGAAYRRPKFDEKGKKVFDGEFVWRDPSIYLTDDFVARCNGLAVILSHPAGATLDSKEFQDRAVGAVLLPFVRGDEVWGIAKVYDDLANELMRSDEFKSTSPAVCFRDPDVNDTIELEDGSKLLIEGKPSLLDHVAICKQGVWDKGGEPRGVINDSEEPERKQAMNEEEKAALAKKDADEKEAQAKKDAEMKADADAGTKLDKLLSHVDSIAKRLDSVEEKFAKKDAEDDKPKPVVADADEKAKEEAEKKAKADADEKEAKEKADAEDVEKKAKADADAKKADSAGVDAIRKEVAELARKIPRQVNDEEYREMATIQARADEAFQGFGKHAPRPLDGETPLGYRRRLATALKVHSPDWKAVDLAAVADSSGFDVIERRIYADAKAAAERPSDLKAGELRGVTRVDSETGRRETRFFGNGTFIGQLKRPSSRATRLGLPSKAEA
jgi:8-oxo-dGTP pyrophosphatase MutT (NUDIX family)